MTRNRFITLLLLGAIAAFSLHLANRWLEGYRADVTAEGLYSLSDGTLEILDRMREEGVQPVEMRLYFSETNGQTLPRFIKDFITYDRYLRNLLREYERASGGKIEIEFIDPLTDSDDALDAGRDGLEGRPINQHGDEFFFGLTLETQTGSRDAIPFLWPNEQDSIEYEISKRLHSLLWPSTQRIGIVASLEVFGTADNPYLAQMLAAQGRAPSEKWISIQLLDETYDIAPIDPEAETISPEEFDLIVVMHPKDLTDRQLWLIDEWVTRGGNALVFVDPYALNDQAPQNPQQPWLAMQYQPSSSLDPLLNAWGLENPAETFAADLELAVRRPTVRGGAAESVVIDLQYDESHQGGELASHPILDGLATLRFFLSGSLEPLEGATAELTPLITTSASGNTLVIRPGFGTPDGLSYPDLNNATKLRDAFGPGDSQVALAYQVRGRLDSAFPDGVEFPSSEPERPPGLPEGVDLPVPEGTEMIRREPVPEEQRGEATVMVFADIDFISDQLAFQRNVLGLTMAANDNHKLLLNAVDHLLGADELMSIRSRSGLDRPFTLFDDIEADAELESLEREREIRTEIEAFEDELQSKQSEITQRNAALFQRKLQEEVDELNIRIQEANLELREIRRVRREALEREESRVRFAVLGWMPSLLLAIGLVLYFRRRGMHQA